MSLLKQLDRAARTCWCPSARFPTLLASGTIAGTIDDSFVTKSQLEIYDIDLANPSSELRLVGSIESKDCFHSVAWGSKGMDDGMTHGVVAGGMSDGSINLWNVDSILSRSGDALLSRSEVHKGQVLGLQFHPSQPNLLASGATDGEVYVWDLANLKAPVPNKPNPAAKAAQLSSITSIAWNRNAPQILASASEVGETTVWDLRQKRSIITIRNSARQNVRTAAITWNPSASVQLAVSYNNYPVAEIWDLRQSMAPKVKLEGFHSNSILSLDWCPNDSNVLLTVGEDARMAAWNPNTGAFLHEYGTHNVAFDVQWSPKQPNLISTSSYDGKVNILSIDTTGPSHVPSWMTRPIGATFGFGGKLTSFGFDVPAPPVAAAPGAPAPQKVPFHPKIQLQQLVTDPEVLDKAQGLQQILKQGDYPGFCNYKITNSAGDDDEKTIWTFMKILFEDEANQRFLLLKELGFEPPVGSDIVPPTPAQPAAAPAAAVPEPAAAPQMSEDEFFNQDFKAPEEEASALDSTASALNGALNGIDAKEPETPAAAAAAVPAGPFVEDADDRAIRQALVFGDFKAAVARCLASNRMADAIVFASFGPSTLWEETRAAYFAQHKMPFIRNIMKNVSNQSLEEMIQQSELNNWKETLAICITYTTAQKYRQVVNQLAQRLEEANMNIPAVVCYICSSNIDKAIDMWTSKIPAHIQGGEGGSALLSLHAAIEKIAVFAHATNAHGAAQAPSKTLSLKYAEYAAMLASQGELRGAFNYLSRVATPNDPNSSVLLDRIFHAESEQFVREHYPMPAFPFPVEIVQPDPTLAQSLHAQAIAKQQRDQMRAQQAQQQAAMNQNRQPTGGFGGPTHAAPAQQPRAAAPYGAPNQPYGNPAGNVGYGNAYGQPNQPTQPSYGAPNPGYGAPAPAAQPRTFTPAAPAYATPAPAPSAYGAPGGYGGHNPNQPNPGYGAPAQPSYGAPAANNFNAPAPAQPPRPAQPAAAPYGAPAPANPSFNQPYAPAAPAAPAPAPFVPAPQPAVFQPAAPAYATPAAVPAAVPAPVAAAPKPFVPAQPAPAAMVPSSAPAPAAAPAAEAPVVLSPADQALINPLEQCLNQLTAVGLKAPEQKKVTEIRGKLQELAKKLSQHELSATALPELQALCNAVASNDFTSAQKHHLNLVKTDWANNNEWLLGLKTMLLMAKKYLEKSG